MNSNLTSSLPDEPHIQSPTFRAPIEPFPSADPLCTYSPYWPADSPTALTLGWLAGSESQAYLTYLLLLQILPLFLLYSNQVFEFSVYHVTLFAPCASLICFSSHLAYLVMLNI